jgi:hypothetical protein
VAGFAGRAGRVTLFSIRRLRRLAQIVFLLVAAWRAKAQPITRIFRQSRSGFQPLSVFSIRRLRRLAQIVFCGWLLGSLHCRPTAPDGVLGISMDGMDNMDIMDAFWLA